jgi:hypothetical protein
MPPKPKQMPKQSESPTPVETKIESKPQTPSWMTTQTNWFWLVSFVKLILIKSVFNTKWFMFSYVCMKVSETINLSVSFEAKITNYTSKLESILAAKSLLFEAPPVTPVKEPNIVKLSWNLYNQPFKSVKKKLFLQKKKCNKKMLF